MKATFCLKKPGSTKPTPIVCYVHAPGRVQVAIAVGYSILPSHWNPKRHRTRNTCPNGATIDAAIRDIETLVATLTGKGEPVTAEQIKAALRSKEAQQTDPSTLIDHYDRFNAEAVARLQPSTIEGHKGTRRYLAKFEKAYDITLTVDQFDSIRIDKFAGWLRNVVGVGDRTIWKQAKNIGAFLRSLAKQGVTVHPAFNDWKPSVADTGGLIYLNRAELEAIQRVDLTGKRLLAESRDMFILQCYTGLRYGDIAALRPENLRDSAIHATAQKTRGALMIPILPPAKIILDRYADRPKLPVAENGLMIGRIREVARLAGIETPCQVVEIRGTDRLERTAPKYELVTTHTGRRTFITLSLEAGMRPEALMKITGHKDIRTLLLYAKITPEISRRELEAAWP